MVLLQDRLPGAAVDHGVQGAGGEGELTHRVLVDEPALDVVGDPDQGDVVHRLVQRGGGRGAVRGGGRRAAAPRGGRGLGEWARGGGLGGWGVGRGGGFCGGGGCDPHPGGLGDGLEETTGVAEEHGDGVGKKGR